MIKVLLIAADPKESRSLKLNEEFKNIYNILSLDNKQFDWRAIQGTTYKDLRRNLLSYKPSIIHFSCHGIGEDGLVLVDNNEKKEVIDTETLADLLKTCQEAHGNIACVIFNACYGEFQAKEIKNYVKYTIGMSHQIKDDHAISFAEAFYEALFLKETIKTAVNSGRNSIRHLMGNNNDNSARAEFNPASGDIVAPQSIAILDYENPKLIINDDLEDIYNNLIGLPIQDKILTCKQWNELHTVLLTIDFDIPKYICGDILKHNIQDIEPWMLALKDLTDIKKLLLEQYPIQKNNNITILDFAARLLTETDISNIEKNEIKNWLEKVAKEKNIDLPVILNEKDREISSDTNVNAYLLISIIENTGISGNFSLEAELLCNYQEGAENYESVTITSRLEGINKVIPQEIESYIYELISIAIDPNKLPTNQKLAIELFVPFDYLGETFDLCKIPIASSTKKRKMKPIGSKYQFTVRCLERYEKIELFRELTQRWTGVTSYFKPNDSTAYLGLCDYLKSIDRAVNWDDLCTKWQRGNFYAINIIDELPVKLEDREDYFDCFLLSGVPISLWSRLPKLKSGVNDDTSIEEKFNELLKIDSFQGLSEVFKRIYQLREDAHNQGDIAKDYLGYHLGFICDRPHPRPLKWRSTKGKKPEDFKGTN